MGDGTEVETADGDAVEVEAAGGVVWRRSGDSVEVLVVHRPRYDDWSFPKGKLEPGETHLEAARREVVEETGLRCEVGAALVEVRYEDRRGRAKRVCYWAMASPTDAAFVANDEVDRADWLGLAAAVGRLTYGHDRRLVENFRARVVDAGPTRSTKE